MAASAKLVRPSGGRRTVNVKLNLVTAKNLLLALVLASAAAAHKQKHKKKHKKTGGGGAPGLPCPRGHGPLVGSERDGMTLDLCPTCQGMWFDWGELEAVLAKYDGVEVPPDARPSGLRCPRDGSGLFAYTLPEPRTESGRWDIEIDQCKRCQGIWLDHGELQRIQDSRSHTEVKGALRRFFEKALRHLFGK